MAATALPALLPQVSGDLRRRKYANLLVSLLSRRRRDATVSSRPIDLTIDPSTVCQLHCPYCEVGNGTIRRKRDLLKPIVHRGFVDELAADAFVAWYFSTGEPLLNRRFAEVVEGVRGTGVFPIVSTNLSLRLSDKRIDEILTCGLGVISVSIDGATAESYARYRVGGDFELVLDNVRRLVARKRELGLEQPWLEWRFLAFGHNAHEVETARSMSRELGMDLFEIFIGFAPNGDDVPVRPAAPGLQAVPTSGPALEAAARRSETTLRSHLGSARGGLPGDGAVPPGLAGQKCDWLYFGATLFPDGSVSPCCVSNNEPDDFGRITDRSGFGEVWNNDLYRSARQGFVSGKHPDLVCRRCPLPPAQDHQFQRTMQGVLRNAPDWVLHALEADPARFFFDVDYQLMPDETLPIRDGRLRLTPDLDEAERALSEYEALRPASSPDVAWLRDLFRRPAAVGQASSSPQGYVDQVDGGRVAGWVRIPARPKERVRVTVRINDDIVGHAEAVEFRPDVQGAIGGDGYHGFVLGFPEGRRARRGDSVSVTVGDDGVHLQRSPFAVTEGDDPAETAISPAAPDLEDTATAWTRRHDDAARDCAWLEGLPTQDGITLVAPAPGEGGTVEVPTDGPARLRSGLGVAELFREHAHADAGALLVWGCRDTGMAEALARSATWTSICFTDPSVDALATLRPHVPSDAWHGTRLAFVAVSGQELARLPREAFSAVLVLGSREALPVDALLERVRPGGLLVWEQDRIAERVRAHAARTLPGVVTERSGHLTPAESQRVQQTLARAAASLSRPPEPDIDLSSASGFEVVRHENRTTGDFVLPRHRRPPAAFWSAVVAPLTTVFGWPDELVAQVRDALRERCDDVDPPRSDTCARVVCVARRIAPDAARSAIRLRSPHGGLWPDRLDFEEALADRARRHGWSPERGERWRRWHEDGIVELPECIDPALLERYTAELDVLLRSPDPRMLVTVGALRQNRRMSEVALTPESSVRLLDHYVFSELARRIAFAEPLVRALGELFEEAPLLFQSLGFEYGSQQGLHQDPAYVVVRPPLSFVGVWIALEDVEEGTGELTYYRGSHRLPEFAFSGRFKHWSPERDGEAQHQEHGRRMHEHAAAMAMQQVSFRPKRGSALIWHADVAHGGLPISRAGATRRSFVGHYCPASAVPHYFRHVAGAADAQMPYDGGSYASQYYLAEAMAEARTRAVETLPGSGA